MTQRITLVALDTNNKEYPLNVDASGNLGVNVTTDVGALTLGAGTAYIGQAGRYRDPAPTLTSTPLKGGGSTAGTYTQTGVNRFTTSPVPWGIRGWLVVDQSGTLYLDESADNSSWTATQTHTITVTAPATAQAFDLAPQALSSVYYRYRFVSGGSLTTNDQTIFILKQALQTSEDRVSGYLLNAYAITGGQSYGTAMNVTGYKMLALSVVCSTSPAITGTATLSFEASIDGTNYVPLVDVTDITSGSDATSVTLATSLNNGYQLMCAGFKSVRINVTTGGGTGTVTVFARAVA
jgi:hypothetical protein